MSERTLSWFNNDVDLLANKPSRAVHEVSDRMALIENGLDGHGAILSGRPTGIGLSRG
jgi:hypothetical protein